MASREFEEWTLTVPFEDEEVQGVGICVVLSVEALCWILFLPSLDYLMNFVEFLNLLGEVAILGLALSPVDDCTGYLPDHVEKLMLAVAIIGVLTQIVVIVYEMGPMLLENAQKALALAKRVARVVGRKCCGGEPAWAKDKDDGDDASSSSSSDGESSPRKKSPRTTTKIVVLD